ncbi:hypothetical protein NADFUDRAFT_45152 [Nadsonia fulvescens var. elongata DSM 6958]|uniref:3-hydroxybutyryl-CoA dehydrogenase n=1 Tax=Nadsonia fulvescens var. elongata DSM 6958 TaxID=857566 RepID=A0A1E3PUZ5_9ASCO|nr:hypothetical protein NADFUDRAFT_45152 [Nadsonia fulvescens var. elongata DSM 6958]
MLSSLNRQLVRIPARPQFHRLLSAVASNRFADSVPAGRIESLAVIGAGQMGTSIAYTAAKKGGVNVFLTDVNQDALDRAQNQLDRMLDREVVQKKISPMQAFEIRSMVNPTLSFESIIPEVDMVIESVSEIPQLKREIFGKLGSLAAPDTILATNTSSISISLLAAAAGTKAADRVIATHFIHPVATSPTCEVARALHTSDVTFNKTMEFMRKLGKDAVVATDTPGFIANRLLIPFINEAIGSLETGVASVEDIDKVMQMGYHMPMGPLRLADSIGLDTCLYIMKVLYNDTGDSKYRPSVRLGRMVDAGYLGQKSGKGFYDY